MQLYIHSGCGLFIGVEFVRDRATLSPATAETSMVCTRLKDEHHILTSIDGAHDNVLVIKPPLCFSQENADTLVRALGQELQSLDLGSIGEGAVAGHTPT